MGRRARQRGVSNKLLRVAQAAVRERDEQVAAIAQHVYDVGRELKMDGIVDQALPPSVFVPLMAAAEKAAPGAAQLAQIVGGEDAITDVAAYLVAGFREMVVMLDRDHFEVWRHRNDEPPVPEE